ncbi:hypothetical protein OU426_17170 [Frigidibacter sp. RF13]|uniref:hypothetical protein n=1 Tax=Frigidibacter sp. RF13 TaxID=2997340 RepID=UPI00226F7E83|nr:hypothetical protein [Frigidibacter sp. RF13]MCY1128594.1 hypothetical protein [Frigidibacter sp. RF13]
MAMSPKEFRRQVVAPNLDEYDKEYDKIHRAFNAVAAVDAYAAHIYQAAEDAAIDPFAALVPPPPTTPDYTSFRQALAGQRPICRHPRLLAFLGK